MGPQHPSMHGVLRLIVTLDGEDVIDCEPILGYLHRGMEKIAENRTIIVERIVESIRGRYKDSRRG
jgi:NADH:ubiquinone oxidoreductase subunit D